MPSSSIFSSDPLRELLHSIRTHFTGEDRRRWLIGLIFLLPALVVAVIPPGFLMTGESLSRRPIRVVHNPYTTPKLGFCEVTEDGLLYFPKDIKPESSILLIGNSHCDWYLFPQWVEQEGWQLHHRIEVLSAARPACSPQEMLDTVIYLLEHNPRRYDAILVKPANSFFDHIAHPPDKVHSDPPIGRGFSLIYTGLSPEQGSFSLSTCFKVGWEKRMTDCYLINRTQRMQQMHDDTLPSKDVQLVTTIPSEVHTVIAGNLRRYQEILLQMIKTSREKGIQLILMTTPGRVFDLNDPQVLAMKSKTPAFFNQYSILGINPQLVSFFNHKLREIAGRESIPVIDTEAFVDTLPEKRNYYHDFVHLDLETEKKHGKYVYEELRRMGL